MPAVQVAHAVFAPASDANVLTGHLTQLVLPSVALVAASGLCSPAGQLAHAQSICVFLRYVPAGHVRAQ